MKCTQHIYIIKLPKQRTILLFYSIFIVFTSFSVFKFFRLELLILSQTLFSGMNEKPDRAKCQSILERNDKIQMD